MAAFYLQHDKIVCMKFLNVFVVSCIALISFSCQSDDTKQNQLTDKEKSEGWQLLFDGNSTKGWHVYNHPDSASAWEAVNGELFLNRESKARHGDLVTDEEFENYELMFEWKIPSMGNSGVFINVVEKPGNEYTWYSGPEYQLLDIDHPDIVKEAKRSGCLYNFGPQKNAVDNKPRGEWNTSQIKQVNGKAEFYLNGVLTAEEDFKSEQWSQQVAESNFNKYPEFGKQTKGRIALQEWSKGISFRNIKLRKL